MQTTFIKIISIQVAGLMVIAAFAEPQPPMNIGPAPDSLQNRFGFMKSVISEPSPFVPPQYFTSFLRPEELSGDEMKSILYANLNKPNPVNTGRPDEYPDRTPDAVPVVALPNAQEYSPYGLPTSVFQMLKGSLSKSMPSIKAFLLTKELPFPKLNQLPFPLKLDLPNQPPTVHHKHKHPIWSYIKAKTLPIHAENNEPHPESVIEQPKPSVYYLPKGIPLESSHAKDEPVTLYLNKFTGPESPESIKVSPESEHSDQPVYKDASSLPPKPMDSLDAIQSQYNEQYTKHLQIPVVNLNEFPSNSPAQQTSVNDFYGSPYHHNPHIVVTRPFSPTWVPNAKKWYPGTHKSAFYPDTRIIKFTINDRIYNNSTKRPNYITRTTPVLKSVPTTTIKPPKLETDETSI